MSKDRTWFLVGKKLAGEASAEELNELEGLLRSDPDMHYALQNITDLWNLPTPANNDVDDAFNRHISRMNDAGVQWSQADQVEYQPNEPYSQRRSRKSLFIISIAAAVLMAASLYWYNSVTLKTISTRPFVAGQAAPNNISTRNGSKTTITLPDGSKVWLNAGSSLTYNKDFGGEIREVDLSGEAFFEVQPAISPSTAQRIPFIIHTRHIDVRVLGTAFNVRSYPGDKQTETSLVHGKVEVLIHNRPDAKIVLHPNEKLVVNNEDTTAPLTAKPGASGKETFYSVGKLTYTNSDSILIETAWVQNKLVFNNESLLEIAQKMERWYNVEISFKDEKIQTERFSGTFENEAIQQALDYISIATAFHYTMQGNKITIDR
ncbi:FecR family protein [Niastella sp. OAS944]|uniref:FecR family protein n=1 Tax=Niastella sp. OAS944 TaxID=2664089 RepID=UPI00347FEC02|nr:ferric-dicitrate binding protein FerR (iron transport regulator) [Chitinophagaceae bacterium OAS944]